MLFLCCTRNSHKYHHLSTPTYTHCLPHISRDSLYNFPGLHATRPLYFRKISRTQNYYCGFLFVFRPTLRRYPIIHFCPVNRIGLNDWTTNKTIYFLNLLALYVFKECLTTLPINVSLPFPKKPISWVRLSEHTISCIPSRCLEHSDIILAVSLIPPVAVLNITQDRHVVEHRIVITTPLLLQLGLLESHLRPGWPTHRI